MAEKKKTSVKADDLRAKSVDELTKMMVDLKKQQMNLRFQKAGGQLSNTAEVRSLRRMVARIKTLAGQQTSGKVVTKAKAEKKVPAKAKVKKAAE